MKIRRVIKIMWGLPILWLGFLRWAEGQEEKLIVNPPLGQIFPLDSRADGIRLQFPVLLNERTILKPNVVLRCVYMDPNAGVHSHGGSGGDGGQGSGMGGGHGHHHGGGSPDDGSAEAGSTFSRGSPGQDSSESAASTSSSSDSNKGSSGAIDPEVWTEADLFRQALDQAADLGTTLVYSAPGKTKPQTTPIDLPDGMFLGEVSGHVQVLGLTEDSAAWQSGLRPEDEIRSFQGSQAVASLGDFLRTYLSVKEEARRSGKSYTIEVWRPSESRLLTIEMEAPPSLHGLL